MKEKLIFFHLLNNYTGSPQVLRNAILAAQEMEKEIHLYTSSGEGFLSGISGIQYHPNYYYRSRFRILTLFTFFISQFVLAFQLFKYWRSPAVFYVNTVLPFSAIWMGKLLRKKVVVHVHEFEVSPKLLNDFLFMTVRNYADEIVVVSNFLAQNPSLVPRSCRVIYNCVKKEIEVEAFTKVEDRGDFRVLMLASLRPYKGIYEFLELARELPKIGFDLVLSDSEEEVDRWQSSQKLAENLTIYPVQQDVIPFYKDSSLVLNLTHKDKCLETFGMTILEGMNFGLPAIVPTVGGMTELVKEGVNGFLVDYNDISTIKAWIEKLQSDVPFWRKLSLNALQKSSFFSTRNFSREIQILLK